MQWKEIVTEGSPDTLAGSYTPDLVFSKQWLCAALNILCAQQSLGTVCALGSWYGNIGVYLQQCDVNFDHLVLVELDAEKLEHGPRLMPDLWDQGRLSLCHCDAGELDYKDLEHLTVINTSSNEMSPQWLDRVPRGTLVVIQGRNNTQSEVPTPTATLTEFDQQFELDRTLYVAAQDLRDPEVSYTRFMKIGYR